MKFEVAYNNCVLSYPIYIYIYVYIYVYVCMYVYIYIYEFNYFNPIQDGVFGASHGFSPPPKICHRYPTIIKLGTVIPYLKKMQNIYKSRDTPFEFCWHQLFYTWIQQIQLYQEIQI